MSGFLAWATFALETGIAVGTATLTWLMWASGYLSLLTSAARARGWGFRKLRPLRKPVQNEDDLEGIWGRL